jgi:hypothetical protein
MERSRRPHREDLELIDHTHDHDAQSSLAEELAAIPYEPLLPVEKRLIAVSLILGVLLLGVLLWVSATFFPVAPAAPVGV